MKATVIPSREKKSKVQREKGNPSSLQLYVFVGDGSKLENPYTKGFGKREIKDIEKYMENFPIEKLLELLAFCEKKKITEILIGIENHYIPSHAYDIAEFFEETGSEFSLPHINPSQEDVFFMNKRDFDRQMICFNYVTRDHFKKELKKLN